MSTLELKADLHNLINEINDNTVLKAVHMLLKKQAQNDVVGYTANMKPLTKKAFIKRIEKAETQVKKGQYVTIEELEKESENW
jgi:hypothetical protein